MAEPFDLTVSEAATQMRRGKLSPVELMESLLARSDTLEPTLQVWVTLDPDGAMAGALKSETQLSRGGARGPLHGVPVGVKDIFYTDGVRTTACSPIYADFVPEYDSTPVARLKRAGAIVMGKTVTTEFAFFDPSPTRNPWNNAHTPGGSSSGSAAGVAARMFPTALGSQTGGSVLRPASYNGVVGLKPTYGRISTRGVMPVAESLDTVGFFTRTVQDAALILQVLAGHDPDEPLSSPEPVPDYARGLASRDLRPRIGLLGQLFHDRADGEVRENVQGVAELLREAGAQVEEVTVPVDFEGLLAAHRVVSSTEAATVHEADFKERPNDYSAHIRGLVESGMQTSSVEYVKAQRVRRAYRPQVEEAISEFDVFLTPTTPSAAPRDLTTTGDPVFQVPWTNAGFPAISLPSGLSASGLPLGVQIIAAPFAEARLLKVAAWCERVLDVRLTPPV